MKNLIIVLLIIGAVFCFMHYKKYKPHPFSTDKKSSGRAADPSAVTKEQESALDSTINYGTGYTQIKALQSTKEKLNKAQDIREKQVNEALGQ